MEVKPGNRQTEVGLIPDDWECTKIRHIASPTRNAIVGGPFGSDLVSNDYVEEGIPVVRGQNMGSRFISGTFAFVTKEKATSLEANLAHAGDLIFTQRGTLGQVSLVPHQPYDRYLVSQSQMKLTVNCQTEDPLFFYYVFSSAQQQEFIRRNTIQTGVPHINLGILRSIPVQRPLLAEQETIAEALSDADAVIESLEQLLTKKRQLKKGVMQALLTSKKRLPGFSRAWGRACLRDLLSYERPDKYIVQDAGYSGRGDIPVLTANKSFVLGYTVEKLGICSDLPVIVFDDFTTASKYVDFPFKVKSSAIKLLRPKHAQVDLRFVFDLMQLIRFPLGDHKRYYISEFQNLVVKVPDHPEQQAIAAILSDMGAEIAALEAKLAKSSSLKQGMMQELLTGRIRLV